MNKLYKAKVTRVHQVQGGKIMVINLVEVKNPKTTKAPMFAHNGFGWRSAK